ncbi:MAG: DUF1549 domain-containing protein [Planctomycetes bacterium]|jgi:hypothetical protein|nr:DUF1549 domain-containing protein [Planctomycetota bacterium]
MLARPTAVLLATALVLPALPMTLPAQPPTPQGPATHWAFVAPQRTEPVVRDVGWCRDPLDRHVLAGLEAAGRRPSPPAEPAVLLRRAHLVLTGLPPTPAAVAAFTADPGDAAYERVVDELLASEACAEHLATDWLDLARFADTYGFQADFECRTWPWRDWLLRALHDDKPWDRFVRELLAGDLLPDANVDTITATAFWRLHRQTNEGGSIDAEWRHEYIADRVDTFGTTLLGLTVGCARCHDHKSDPISQRDYYALGSFFAIDDAGLYPYTTGAVPRPVVRLADAAQQRRRAELAAAIERAEVALRQSLADGVPAATIDAGPLAPREPIAWFRFDRTADGACHDLRHATRAATVPAELPLVTDAGGTAVDCNGDGRITVPELPAFGRADAFSVRLRLWCGDARERAVVLHTANYTEDADAQGYQLLLEHGHLCWQLVHLWPGSALAVRATAPLPQQRWCDVLACYDGSCRADGLALYVDGERVATTVVRDHLDGPSTVRTLELAGRDRDTGLLGRLAEFALFDVCLTAAEVAVLAQRAPTGSERAAHAAALAERTRVRSTELRTALQALHSHDEAIPELMVMAAHRHPPERFVLRRGAYDQPDRSKPVQPDAPAAVLPFGDRPRDRLGLAQWLDDPRHPLATRVAVDRLWALCFGRGLVATPENFGVLGAPPRQRALLDALAVDFRTSRSQKQLLRRIVTSATFRQSSVATAAEREADPHNDQLARGPSFRLSAEVLRDQALAASGLLHVQFGGPSSKPWQPPGLWRDAGVGWGGEDYVPDQGPAAHRRSLYTWRKRTAPPPNMLTLDGTSREVCNVRRQVTDTPLQALVLLSDPVFTECAQALAQRALALPGATLDTQLAFVFTSLCGRAPRAAELDALRTLHAKLPEPEPALAAVASTVMACDAAVVLR